MVLIAWIQVIQGLELCVLSLDLLFLWHPYPSVLHSVVLVIDTCESYPVHKGELCDPYITIAGICILPAAWWLAPSVVIKSFAFEITTIQFKKFGVLTICTLGFACKICYPVGPSKWGLCGAQITIL